MRLVPPRASPWGWVNGTEHSIVRGVDDDGVWGIEAEGFEAVH